MVGGEVVDGTRVVYILEAFVFQFPATSFSASFHGEWRNKTAETAN
jgi:hypothetical protein